jgi:hypothetical protein
MKAIVVLLAATTLAAPAFAQEDPKPRAEVVERNERGQATKVSVEGKVYEVCRDGKTDGCINPREAGLDFGSVPLDHWPGKPASEGGK